MFVLTIFMFEMSFFHYIFVTFLLTTSQCIPISPRAEEDYRLPYRAVEVELYTIHLTLADDVFTDNTFVGTTSIVFTNINGTDIKIHANGLNFTSIALRNLDGGLDIPLEDPASVPNPTTDILTLTPVIPLVALNRYDLTFEFDASLRTSEMDGFYKSSYITSTGERRFLGTTQFQPGDARKAFPCFDEPLYKARFDISITHPSGYHAVGNTEIISSEPDPANNNSITTIFARTPIMSTYLIAFVVSDFTCTNGFEVEPNIPYDVCSRDEAAQTRQVAVDIGPGLISALSNFTGISYGESGLTKLHQFAIPDFSAGAMENWGLVTYRETALLWDETESSNRNKQRVETVVAHEFAHFWFGNLVTTHWWSDTFLNEGFATYFEYYATAEIEPTWELERQFVLEQLQSVLVSDSSPTSQALSSAASSPAQVSSRFSSISYNKGGSIFRMVAHFMGLENFKAGINKYLNDNKFNCTTPEDLWAGLEEFALPSEILVNQPLPLVMRNWVYNPGYPVLDVVDNGPNVTIHQRRFLSSGTPNPGEEWYVPVSFTIGFEANKFEDTKPRVWLLPNTTLTLTSFDLNATHWIILNNQQTGYYRVNYDEILWKRIQTALLQPEFDGIDVLNRAQIIDDFYNFVRYENYTYTQFFDLIQFLRNDTSYYSWYTAINAFNSMLVRVGNPLILRALSDHILELMEAVYETVPFNATQDDNQIYTHNRVLINTWACRLGRQSCIDSALVAFANYNSTLQRPDKNLRSVIYCNGLRHSQNPRADWEFLWMQYLNSTLATEQSTLLSTLGCITDETLTIEYLNKSISADSGIRPQDASSVFSTVYTNNPNGTDIALTFLVEHYKQIAEYYGSMNSLINIFSGLTGRFNRQDQIDEFERFVNESDLDDAIKTSANNYLRSARANLQITETLERELFDYFSLGGEENNTTESSTITAPTSTTITIANTTVTTSPENPTTTTTPTENSTTASPVPDAAVSVVNVSFISLFMYLLLHIL